MIITTLPPPPPPSLSLSLSDCFIKFTAQYLYQDSNGISNLPNKQIHIPVEGIRLLDAVWKRSPQGPPIYIVEVQCNSRRARGAELDSCCCKQEEPLQRVAWGWCIYNIVESESDPLTRRAVDLFEKEPLKGNSEVHLHTPTKFGEDPSKDLGGDREQTDRQTNRQTDKRCSIYSMIHAVRWEMYHQPSKILVHIHHQNRMLICSVMAGFPT